MRDLAEEDLYKLIGIGQHETIGKRTVSGCPEVAPRCGRRSRTKSAHRCRWRPLLPAHLLVLTDLVVDDSWYLLEGRERWHDNDDGINGSFQASRLVRAVVPPHGEDNLLLRLDGICS